MLHVACYVQSRRFLWSPCNDGLRRGGFIHSFTAAGTVLVGFGPVVRNCAKKNS